MSPQSCSGCRCPSRNACAQHRNAGKPDTKAVAGWARIANGEQHCDLFEPADGDPEPRYCTYPVCECPPDVVTKPEHCKRRKA